MAAIIYTGADGFEYTVIDGTSLYIAEHAGTVGTLRNITAIREGTLTLEDQTTVDLSNITHLSVNLHSDHKYSLGDYAFKHCESLATVNLNAVDTIGRGAFYYCTSLEQVYNQYITHIPYQAFFDCYNLFRADLPNAISVDGEAFHNTSITGLPSDKLITIGVDAFVNALSITELHIPETVTSIGACAFYGCYRVNKLHFYGSRPLMDTECFAFGLPGHETIVEVTDSAGGWTADSGLELYSNQYTTFDYQTEPVPPVDESFPIELASNVNVYGNLHIRNGTIRDDGLPLPRKVNQQEMVTNVYTNTMTVHHNLGEAPSSVLLFIVENTQSGKTYTQLLADVTATDDDITISFSTLPPYGSKLLIKALI